MGEEEGFEEWDADFLDQLIKVEELAFTSTSTQLPPPQQPPPQQPPYQPPYQTPYQPLPQFHYAASSNHINNTDNLTINHSPPRIFSQRIISTTTTATTATDYAKSCINAHSSSNQNAFASIPVPIPTSTIFSPPVRRNGDSDDELEVDKLKKELGLVSKQLLSLKQECLELRKERDKKEKHVKSVFSAVEAKDADVQNLKSTHSNYGLFQEQAVIASKLNEQVGSRLDTAASTYKGVGVQTEKFDDSSPLLVDNGASPQSILSKKLLALWNSSSGQRSASDLVSKLFVTCSADFQVLFGCLNANLLSKTIKTLEKKSACDFATSDLCQTANSSEVSKISHLYTVLTKISSGMFPLEVLVKALLDLCNLENVAIVYRCLRVLHAVLRQLLTTESGSERSDNVVVEGNFSGKKASYSDHTPAGMRLFDPEILHEKEFCSYGTAMSVSCIDWVSLFKLMHQISLRNNEEHVIYEAASIMIVIFLKSNAYSERDKFEERLVFESISQLIKKEAGIRVQKQAVQLFFLSLNCPKLLHAFCSGYKVVEIADAAITPAFSGFSSILQGLADCVASCGDASQDLTLSRKAIILLAFLASSGNAGFEIVSSHELSKRANFLVLILRLLQSEMNLEAAETTHSPEMFKERTLLIREALIFLNRLVSNPVYSSDVLRVLTNSRDAASLTVDISNRLSRKDQGFRQRDRMIKQMRDSEIVDLARAFRKRVFAYLGEKH